jgi:threonine/homoserine/homoserine lactone efflux protein
MAWKLKASMIWLVIVCVLWVCGFFLLTLPEPGNRELVQTVGEILGEVSGVLLVLGLIVLFTRPKAQ